MLRTVWMTGVALALGAQAAWADPVKLDIPTLPVPSLGYFLPPIIHSQHFDTANGLDLAFTQKSASTYRTDFAAGTDLIGGSGTILADVALLSEKGVDTVYLFNVFDFWATVVVPSDSDVKSVKDLKGKTLAAALPTTSYAMFRDLAQLEGLDMNSVQIRGTASQGLIPMARSGRVDAVELWEPAYSILTHGNHDFRSLDIMSAWKRKTGLSTIPYLGVAAHRSWVETHHDLIPRLFKTYQDAASYVEHNPEKAAQIIGKSTKLDPKVLRALLSSDRLGLKVYWAADERPAAEQVFKAGVAIGYLKKMPSADVLYSPAASKQSSKP